MLLKTVNRNSLAALALLPLFLIGLWAKALLSVQMPGFPFDQTPMPLWGLVLKVLKGNQLIAASVSLLMALIMMLGVNRIVNRYSLSQGQTALPGMVYLFLVSGYQLVQNLHPVWFFSPLFLLSIERLFTAHGQRKPMAWCFDAAFWLSVGTLFYAKGIFFLPFLWMTMFILRLFSLRSIVASFIGVLLPYLFALGYYFFIDKQTWFFELIFENFVSPVAFFDHSLISQIYNGVIIFLIFISILSVVRLLPIIKIISRKHYRIFIWLIVLSMLAAITPYFSVEIIPVFAIGSAMVISRFLNAIRRPFWQETFFALLLIMTIIAQIFI